MEQNLLSLFTPIINGAIPAIVGSFISYRMAVKKSNIDLQAAREQNETELKKVEEQNKLELQKSHNELEKIKLENERIKIELEQQASLYAKNKETDIMSDLIGNFLTDVMQEAQTNPRGAIEKMKTLEMLGNIGKSMQES